MKCALCVVQCLGVQLFATNAFRQILKVLSRVVDMDMDRRHLAGSDPYSHYCVIERRISSHCYIGNLLE